MRVRSTPDAYPPAGARTSAGACVRTAGPACIGLALLAAAALVSSCAPLLPLLPPHDPLPGDFTIVALPDTQYYSAGRPEIFMAQTRFIVEQREALNIVAVLHLGDIVDNAADERQWQNAAAALAVLDEPGDLPYGLCVGNHDEHPSKSPIGTAVFNRYFPASRYEGVAGWYGGHFGDDNDNHYILFSGGGVDFVAVMMEFEVGGNADVIAWADGVLKQHADRKAIICTHYLMRPFFLDSAFSRQGRAIYEGLKGNSNLLLMMGGHFCGFGRRSDVFEGRTVHAFLADFQCAPQGGDGWLRLLRISPARRQIRVQTYSPTRDEYLRDFENEFVWTVDFGPTD